MLTVPRRLGGVSVAGIRGWGRDVGDPLESVVAASEGVADGCPPTGGGTGSRRRLEDPCAAGKSRRSEAAEPGCGVARGIGGRKRARSISPWPGLVQWIFGSGGSGASHQSPRFVMTSPRFPSPAACMRCCGSSIGHPGFSTSTPAPITGARTPQCRWSRAVYAGFQILDRPTGFSAVLMLSLSAANSTGEWCNS